jgi:hypothetical protein
LENTRIAQPLPAGLTMTEVAELTAQGKVNKTSIRAGKSYGRIILDNLFTFFNMIWVVVTLVLIAVGIAAPDVSQQEYESIECTTKVLSYPRIPG